MRDLGLQLEQEIGVEVVIFGFGQLVSGEPPDRLEVVPQGEHLDVDRVAFAAVQAPGAAIALGRAVVG